MSRRLTASAALLLLSVALLGAGELDHDKWRAGSARTLTGKVYTLSIFISEPGDPWRPADKLAMLDRQRSAESWLATQAKRYGKELTFEHGQFGLEQDVVLEVIPEADASGDEPVDWVSRVVPMVGYTDALQLYRQLADDYGCDNAHVIIYANKRGIGYAMAYSTDMDEQMYFVEGAILHRFYPDGREMTTASIAHELLHLYGAWDLYQTFSQTADVEAQARKTFADDIMLRVSYDIHELEVGELTAWLVGWHDQYKDWYAEYRPTQLQQY
jgi:hypothetical protein